MFFFLNKNVSFIGQAFIVQNASAGGHPVNTGCILLSLPCLDLEAKSLMNPALANSLELAAQ